MRTFAEQANYIRGVEPEPLIIEVLDVISQEYEAYVLFGTKTAEEAVRDAARAADIILGHLDPS